MMSNTLTDYEWMSRLTPHTHALKHMHGWTLAEKLDRLSTVTATKHDWTERVDESDSERRGALEAERQRQRKVVSTTLFLLLFLVFNRWKDAVYIAKSCTESKPAHTPSPRQKDGQTEGGRSCQSGVSQRDQWRCQNHANHAGMFTALVQWLHPFLSLGLWKLSTAEIGKNLRIKIHHVPVKTIASFPGNRLRSFIEQKSQIFADDLLLFSVVEQRADPTSLDFRMFGDVNLSLETFWLL